MPEIILHHFFNDRETTFQVPESDFKIGRQGDLAIHKALSQDKKISRSHARIYYELSTWWVEDLGSTHGTLLNNVPVRKRMSLYPGNILRLGNTLLRVEFEDREGGHHQATVGIIFRVRE